jgi:hypothetical protein
MAISEFYLRDQWLMWGVTPIKGRISIIDTWEKSSLHSFLPPFLLVILLWCWADSSLSTLLLVMHKEKVKRDLWTVAVMKPARGTTIRFLGSASIRQLKVVQLLFVLPWGRSGSSTSMVYFIYFALIIQAPQSPRWTHDSPYSNGLVSPSVRISSSEHL